MRSRRLSRTVGTDECGRLTATDLKRHSSQSRFGKRYEGIKQRSPSGLRSREAFLQFFDHQGAVGHVLSYIFTSVTILAKLDED
jgi:hypothetical protein